MFSPAADDVESLLEFFDHDWDVGGVILQIAIHGDNEVTCCGFDAGVECGCLAEVFAEFDDRERLARLHLFYTLIFATIVDEDNFEGAPHGFTCVYDARMKLSDVACFVVDWDDDGESRRVHAW